MNLQAVYDAIGANYQEAVSRLGNSGRVERFLEMFLSQDSFPRLEEAMDRGDMASAFTAAHDLKGVAGILALTRLSALIIPFVQMLRNESDIPGAVTAFPALKEMYSSTIEKLRSYEAEKACG